MNEIETYNLALSEYMDLDGAISLGGDYGIEVRHKLISKIDQLPQFQIIHLSMNGIKFFESSFCREAIVKTIKHYRTKKGFCVTDIENEDYIENFFSPAHKQNQPVFVKTKKGFTTIGPSEEGGPSKANRDVLTFIQSRASTTATEIVNELGLKLTNASSKLKQLLEQGFVLRSHDTAESGGVEYIYYPIR